MCCIKRVLGTLTRTTNKTTETNNWLNTLWTITIQYGTRRKRHQEFHLHCFHIDYLVCARMPPFHQSCLINLFHPIGTLRMKSLILLYGLYIKSIDSLQAGYLSSHLLVIKPM